VFARFHLRFNDGSIDLSVGSKGFENHPPQYDGRDNLADKHKQYRTGFIDKCCHFLRAGGWFGWHLFTTFHVGQSNQTAELLAVYLIEDPI
jgi:hypothetical protein